MRTYTYTDRGETWIRVSKRAAVTAFMRGDRVALCPVNLRPGAPWHPEYIIHRDSVENFTLDEIGVMNCFTDRAKSFAWYNCTCAETGKYLAYYVEEVTA